MSNFSKICASINEHITKLQENPQYSRIAVEVICADNNESNGLAITSNAGMWLSHSIMFSKEISDYIKKEYKEGTDALPMSVTLKFSKMSPSTALSPENISARNKEKANEPSNAEQASFATEKPKYKLEDVILPEETINSIKEAISTIESFDMVYNQWNFRSKEPSAKTNICFFGAPGTGKTMCAHAIAESLNKEILIASYADIQSQYVGVGPKNLKAVFKTAEERGALLFFDEADSFLRKRSSDNSSSASMHYNSMTNEMMKHLEDFNGIVIFATNLTENTDDAFKTRLSFSIEFKEPDEACRAKIIEKMIPSQVPLVQAFTTDDYIEMSKACEGMVGRDIRNSVKTILSVGAQNKEYPFTKEQFLNGFKKYKENKSSFDKNSGANKNQKSNPMDIYTSNGCIHNLLTYAAWIDGKENETETEYLKMFSKILSRNKLVINSLDDLPEFEEICHEVTDDSLKKKAVRYYTFFMAMTKQEKQLYDDLLGKLTVQLSLDSEFIQNMQAYYEQVKALSTIKEKVS